MTMTIERLGHLGDGIAPGPVFVPMSLPGEVVEGEISDGRIADARIVTPSPHRVKPPCPHYKSCGACGLMHASDAFVAEWKEEVVRTALVPHGLEATFLDIITSPPRSRRRASLSGRRTKKGALVGFHARSSDRIIEIPQCRLLHPDLMAAIPALHEVTILGGSRKGLLTLTVTRTLGGIDLSVSGGKALDQSLSASLASLAERAGLARLSWDGETLVTREAPAQIFGSARAIPPSGAFLQATEAGEAALVSAVAEAVGDADRIADLFCGSGTFALPLSRQAVVHAVEGDAAMLSALDLAWRQTPGLHGLSVEARDLFRRPLEPDELARFGAVVLDPPRAGAEAQAQTLSGSAVPVIAAVSCNPVSFARDAAILVNGGYRIDWIRVVDQFRWSPHVELVARLSR